MSKRGGGSAFNMLSVVLLGLTAVMCLCYAMYLVPGLPLPFAAPTRVTALRLPTATPTTPGLPTLPPTWTPTVTGTPTETPLPPTETMTPGPTSTRYTYTPIPTRTQTPTPGPSPTPSPTRSQYPYTAQVTYQPSPIQPCGSSYILGTITDLSGQPVTTRDIIIHVEGDADIDTGSLMHPGEGVRGNKLDGPSPYIGMGFGPSAWSVVINLNGTSAGTWFVWLMGPGGAQLSDRIELNLQSACAYSAGIVRFQQNH